MKKFLFTLVALLMAGSMVADNYFYIQDFEVPESIANGATAKARRMKVPVAAHFDDMVSGWQTWVAIPEGCELKNSEAGPDMTIQGLDAEGNPKGYAVALSAELPNQTFIGASMEAGYYYPEGVDPDEDDPTPCGANKWLPGDYEVMFYITIQFPENFQGPGEISFTTKASSGDDPRFLDGTYTRPDTQTTWATPEEFVTEVTVEQPALLDLTGEIVISEPSETGVVTVTYTGDEDVTITVNCEPVAESYQLEDGVPMEFAVVVSAEGYNDLEKTETRTWNAPVVEPEDLTGELVITPIDMEGTDGGYFTVEYTGEEAVNIVVTADEAAKATLTPEDGKYRLPAYGKYDVKAVASAEGYNDLEKTAQLEWTRVDAPAATLGGLTTTPTDVTVTVAGSNVTLYEDEDCTIPVENPYIVNRPAYDPDNDASYTETVYAMTTAEGAEPTVTAIPFNVPEMLPTPDVEIDIQNVSAWLPGEPEDSELENGKSYVITIDVPAEFADNVYYTLSTDPETVVKWDGNDIPLKADQYGEGTEITVTAWVAVDNDESPKDSDTATLTNNFTSVNELVNGKAVAGVRFFNLAGQEMQEANGVTIVVTTYTDGTTSAVKVMK